MAVGGRGRLHWRRLKAKKWSPGRYVEHWSENLHHFDEEQDPNLDPDPH
jgi:hypothetical protein